MNAYPIAMCDSLSLVRDAPDESTDRKGYVERAFSIWAETSCGDGGLGIEPAVMMGTGFAVSLDCTCADESDLAVTISCTIKTGLASLGEAYSLAILIGENSLCSERAEDTWAFGAL